MIRCSSRNKKNHLLEQNVRCLPGFESNDYDIKNAILSVYIAHFKPIRPVADTISPEMGAPTLRGGGANIRLYDFVKFSQKLHEVERI